MYTLYNTLFEISTKTTFMSPPLDKNFIIYRLNKKERILNS